MFLFGYICEAVIIYVAERRHGEAKLSKNIGATRNLERGEVKNLSHPYVSAVAQCMLRKQ